MECPMRLPVCLRWGAAPAVLAGLAMFAILTVYSPATARAGDPPGDCWGGALSADPLHCYVVDQAHSAGVIDVEAMYEAGGVLYIYLTQTDPVGDEVGAFFKEAGHRVRGEVARPGPPG